MIEIRLLDEKWMEETLNCLLYTESENITELEKNVWQEPGYQEELTRISEIEAMAAGTPAEDVLFEYRDAIESKAGYLYNVAYLNGFKKGFQIAMFLKPECSVNNN